MEQSDSVIHIQTFFFIFFFHYGLSQEIEYSSLYYIGNSMLPIGFYLWSIRSFIIITFSLPSSSSPTIPIPSMHLIVCIYTKPSCWYNEACTLIFVGSSLFLKYPWLLYLHKKFWRIENSPEANNTVLELINEFGKVAGHKINIHMSLKPYSSPRLTWGLNVVCCVFFVYFVLKLKYWK